MSTIEECLKSGTIVPIVPPLSWRQTKHRSVFAKLECVDWMRNVLRDYEPDGMEPGAAKPMEQVAVMLRKFAAGEDFQKLLPHEMNPLGQGVWRLRTPDVRFVGWFPQHCTFVVSDIDLKVNCTQIRDNQMYAEAVQFRKDLNLLDGAYLEGELDDLIRI